MALDKRFIFQMAAAQLQVAGQMIQANDSDGAGTDDILGKIISIGGKAVGSFAARDIQNVNQDLKVIADGIYEYLGLVPLESGEK